MKNGSDVLHFLKAQLSSLAATAADFTVYGLLHYGLSMWYLAASVTGTISGGLVNFMIGRQWVFAGGVKRVRIQAMRYLLVWNGSLALNAAGVYLLTEYAHTEPTIAKLLVSLLVAFTYNYQLQKNFVFK